ncbi:polymer biosynthesis protein, WecB/TagA/CpsF family [Roseivivax lentus]|uniref:Polymer biosynthesis protein, WecB/TagA/CpsF family n=1 Tax=Roseivivax lentus TaxID=633194 RepID=A0A1N7JWC1_9RHOB|nr:WecB/TagA/CpsF family glycosyltransferase [Roseivivax lentus]SIS53571.1 polymer biosynthesis protein, WecB/TagA/CpsF family [Roseivivax lentus]
MNTRRAMTFETGETRIAVTVRDRAALDAQLRERMRRGEGYALATINLDHLVKLRRDPAFRAAYAAHDLVTADGNPIVWLGRLAGHDLSLVTGSDAIVPMCRTAAQLGVKVGFVGSTDAVLQAARAYLRGEVPNLEIAFAEAPPMGFDPDGPDAADILDRAAAAGAGLLFLALGAPKQERFAALGRRLQPEMGFASIGAGLDFFSGTQRRAPAWMRRFALEWVWRMLSDPRRLALRYTDCAAILPREVFSALRQRRHR